MIDQSNRLNNVEEYYFSKKLREVSNLINSGESVINMGVGSPDMYPSQKVINAIKSSMSDPSAHKYQSYQGIPELRKAISNFYKKFFNVKLNPKNEILPLLGSKEGIMHISLAFLNPGDKVLIPNPGYPTYLSATKLVEAEPIFYDLSEKNNWFPEISELEKKDLLKVCNMHCWLLIKHFEQMI